MAQDQLLDRFLSYHPQIRQRFPQIDRDILGNQRIHLNCGAGTLMVDLAISSMAEAAKDTNPQPGEDYPSEDATRNLHVETRQIIADFISARSPAEITFHLSTTNALFNLAFSLRNHLSSKNNLVVTDLDHFANISPWETVWGEEHVCEIRRAKVKQSGLLDLDHFLSLVDGKTGLVALTMASNAFGSIVPLKELASLIKAKAPACLICVDAVHHALHGVIDVQELGCDFLAFSGYKIFGPMLGVLWGREALLETLLPYRVPTNKNKVPFKFEQGSLSNAALASLKGALEYLHGLGIALGGESTRSKDRRSCFQFVMTAISSYEREISRRILAGLENLDSKKFWLYGLSNPELCNLRDPTFLFEIPSQAPKDTKKYLWKKFGIQIADGTHYSAAVVRYLKRESLCRASFAHYNSLEEADLFLKALESLAR